MNPLRMSLCLVWLSVAVCPPAPAPSPEQAAEAEMEDLRLEVQELQEDVEDIKEDIEVVKLKEDIRDITEDVEDIKEVLQDFREEDSQHNHVNPYRFFNKMENGVEKPRKEQSDDNTDKMNPFKLRKIVKFCGSSEISIEAKSLCSDLVVLQMRLSEVMEKGSRSDWNEEGRKGENEEENEVTREQFSRSKRDA